MNNLRRMLARSMPSDHHWDDGKKDRQQSNTKRRARRAEQRETEQLAFDESPDPIELTFANDD